MQSSLNLETNRTRTELLEFDCSANTRGILLDVEKRSFDAVLILILYTTKKIVSPDYERTATVCN